MTDNLHPLRQYRRDHGVTLKTLAEKVKTTKANLSRIETFKQSPSFGLAGRLSRETGLPLAQFLRDAAA
jgi:transcriptional regulator with XRE-family HTH domain